MKSVLVRLQEYKSQSSSAEKGIVQFILEHPEDVVGCSIKTLAEKTYTSPATIVRLCTKAGFTGYKEFHKCLLYELAIRKESSKEKRKEITKEDDLESIVNKVTYKNIVSLEDTRKLVDLENLRKCVEILDRSEVVYLFGVGSSLLVARDMYLKLLRVDKRCGICDDWHAQLLQARNVKKTDMALIVSYSGMTEEMISCAKAAKLSGALVVSITRFEDSPLARISDYCLPVAATELVFRSGAMSSRISQLNMVDIVYTAYINLHYEECMKQFTKTHIEKPLSRSEGEKKGEK